MGAAMRPRDVEWMAFQDMQKPTIGSQNSSKDASVRQILAQVLIKQACSRPDS